MTILTTLGCRKEDPNPEISDPIYKDLVAELRQAEGRLDSSNAAYEKALAELKKSEPRTLDRKNAESEVVKHSRAVTSATQTLEFLKIRTERRRVEVRRAYKIAFASEKPWPNPKEIREYEVNKRLRTASRNWGDRVPKLRSQMNTEDLKVESNKEKAPSSGH